MSNIHVDLESVRAADELADYLCSHGLIARVVEREDHCELEVADAVDPDERLRGSRTHSARGFRPRVFLVPVARSEHSYVLRFPGD